MKEKKITKQELFLLKEYSTIDDQQFKLLYDTHGSATAKQWKDFIYYALLVCGLGFLVSGIVFFFAFNWDKMVVNAKFVLVGIGILVSAFFALTSRVKKEVNEISLLVTSLLIGVMLAVFGQHYQTGANAYDLFLTWLLLVTPLTLVSSSSFQWLFFSVLANTTLLLALNQVLQVNSVFVGTSYLILLNVALFILPQIKQFFPEFQLAKFYQQIQLIALLVLAVSGFGFWLYAHDIDGGNEEVKQAWFTLLLTLLLIGSGFGFGSKRKQIYLYSYALIAIICCGLLGCIKLFKDSSVGFLLYMLYAIGAIFFIIKVVSTQSKAWKHEN